MMQLDLKIHPITNVQVLINVKKVDTAYLKYFTGCEKVVTGIEKVVTGIEKVVTGIEKLDVGLKKFMSIRKTPNVNLH